MGIREPPKRDDHKGVVGKSAEIRMQKYEVMKGARGWEEECRIGN